MKRTRTHIWLLLLAVSMVLALGRAQAPKTERTQAAKAERAQAEPGTLIYAGALPNKILVIDEAQEKVIDQITLQTGIPRGLTLSLDRKKLYARTPKDQGIEVIDLATRQVTNHFVLRDGNRLSRIIGLAPDPGNRVLYATIRPVIKQADRFEIEKPKFAVIDLAQKKIIKTVDFPKDDDSPFAAFGDHRVSPDGKFLYIFRENVYVYDTTDFKQVEKIELSKPQYPGMEAINLGLRDDPYDEPGVVTSVFNTTDPVVHRSIFGIGRVDLAKRTFDFTPVGPTGPGMMGLRVTPDRKTGYTVAFQGSGGDRRVEFWVFDMTTRRVTNRVEFPGPTNFGFALSGNGKQIYIHGSAPVIEIYDAATLKLKKTMDVNADLTTGLVVVRPRPS